METLTIEVPFAIGLYERIGKAIIPAFDIEIRDQALIGKPKELTQRAMDEFVNCISNEPGHHLLAEFVFDLGFVLYDLSSFRTQATIDISSGVENCLFFTLSITFPRPEEKG